MQLKELSYYQTGGTSDEIISPNTLEQLADHMARIQRDGQPCFFLGAGSNSLIMDEHWPGTVMLFNGMTDLVVNDSLVTVQAGVENTRLAEQCWKASLTGVEWMYCLPGQLGGTVRMNARCYDGEISSIVRHVTTVTRQGRIRRYKSTDIFRGYKDTVLMENGEIVAEVEIALSPGDPDKIRDRMEYCRTDREKKHQFDFPSCGCVFKNDYTVGVPSGLLLDRAGVKGLSTDSVQVSPWHANFIFNRGATAREILEIALDMRIEVYNRFGIWLTFEMEILGLVPEDLKARLEETRPPAVKESEIEALRRQFASGQST